MYDNIDPHGCDPPGTSREIIPHPQGGDLSIEKAIVMEHRFAFFFWMKWRNLLKKQGLLHQPAPTLITIDWHRDLAPPTEEQKKNLGKLDQSNLSDVVNYIWARFDQTNDGHILCAAWLNLVGDVILLKNSAEDIEETFKDKKGNQHSLFEFRDYQRFQQFLGSRNDHNIFLDIDLDYFVHGKTTRDGYLSDNFSRYTDEEIKTIIRYDNQLFEHILPNIDGMTIAQEPGYCGGISNSCKILDVVHSQLFSEQGQWRHLATNTNS